MNAVTGSSKRADALTNRARLLEVAQAVFAEAGLDLEVNDIISRAQLGVGTFYRHFGNREDLLREVVTQTMEDVRAQLHQAIEPHSDDPHAALQALVAALLRMRQQFQPLLAAMRDRRLAKLFDLTQREALYGPVLDPSRWVIERGIQTGVFRQDLNLDLAAATIIGSFTTVFALLGDHYPPDELVQQLSQLLWTSFAKTD